MKPMSLERFGRYVARIVKNLPVEIKEHLHNVEVYVEDEPDPERLRRSGYTEEEIAEGVALFGEFLPLGADDELPEEDDDEPLEFPFDYLDQPHRLIIYKGPHEREFLEKRRMLIEIRKTVIHELAHHFGYSEKDLARFDDNPDPFGEEVEE
jgi:predicted Zn-dependent protease with MMP-like domain